MADEPASTTTEAPAATTEPAAAEPAEVAAPEPIDWDSLQSQLERAYEADPKAAAERLKKHRAVAGIAGSLAERRFEEIQRQNNERQQIEAAEKAREDLRKLAQEKPLEFADMFLSHDDAEQARQRISAVERNAAKKMMEQIGAAYHGLPEWKDLTDDEKGKLNEALANVNEDEVLPRFNRAALDIVADRRAENRLRDRLPKEQEAWKKQWEAERLASEASPDLRRPNGSTPKRVDWRAMDDKDFDKWWKETYGR